MAGVLRRLQGVSYWIIEDPRSLYEFINTNVRLEWESDVRDAGGTIEGDQWLQALSRRRWTLEVLRLGEVRLNPVVMNHKSEAKGYDFQLSLAKRTATLENGLKSGAVIWPLIVDETMILRDGYCRYSTLGSLGVSEAYCYLGTLSQPRGLSIS
jgi:hypothetical protein